MCSSTNKSLKVRLFPAMRTLSQVKAIRMLLAPLLALWIAGAGCMLGCEGMVAAAAQSRDANAIQHSKHTSTIVASGHACASGGTGNHNCCKKSVEEVSPEIGSSVDSQARPRNEGGALILSGVPSSGMMDPCPFAVGRSATIAKTRSADTSAAPQLPQSTLQFQSLTEQTTPLSSPLRLPNRGHTYLHCCVFLI
jgi:hypothetical protein